jgi:type I restriction enzyme S subunit
MKPAQLLEHFDRISEAPDAVARLRRFILDLAVRGKLVEQDSNDEPASELFKRIQAVKSSNVAGTRKQALITKVGNSDVPFPAPLGWLWLRFGLVHDLVRGVTYTKSDVAETQVADYLPILRANNIGASLNFDDLVFVRQECIGPDQMLRRGDYLIALSSGSKNLVGKAAFVDADHPCGFGGFCGVIRLISPSLEQFVGVFLSSRLYRDAISAGSRGIGINNLKRETLNEALFPLPPLAEQHRIVAKVDELMALCDQLEAAKNEREEKRDRLVAASLHRIGTAPTATDEAATEIQSTTPLRDVTRFHLDHLPRLTTRPEHIKKLRQTILNLAVRGRLVPQDPSDEPAADLLARKVWLPSGYTRRRKILKETSVDAPASLFPAIPLTWKYTDIQSLYDLNVIIDYADGNHGALYPRSNEFGDDGVTFVTAKDLVDGRVIWKSCAKLNEDRANQLPKGWAQGGDVLLTHNATVGRVARIEANVGRFLLGTSVTFYRLNRTVLGSDYFYYLLKSSMWQGQLEAIMAQTSRNQGSIQKQAFFRVVVPPLAEQHRIVAKIDELMALCDQLEAQLTTTQTDSRRLLEAVLHEAFSEAA